MKTRAPLRAALLVCAGLLAGCSAIFDFESVQCSTNADCTNRGGQFASSVCTAGVCRSLTEQPDCTSNADCTGSTLCRENKCVSLLLGSKCPYVVGEESLRAPSPIVFGAFAPFNSNPAIVNEVRNYKLAIEEFNESSGGGLPGGPDGTRRPFAAVVCQAWPDTAATAIDDSVKHLLGTVGVAGVAAALEPNHLQRVFETIGRDQGRFFLGIYLADSTITTLQDDGLVWNLLPDSLSMASVYPPLISAIEQHLALAEPLRVATVEGSRKIFTDLGNSLKPSMVNGTLERYALPSVAEDPSGQQANLVLAKILQELKPHVVISLAGEDFLTRLLPPIEQSLKPFYVFSAPDAASPTLTSFVQAHPELADRSVGVQIASAEDTTLYDAYLSRYKQKYPDATSYDSFESFYDAPYYIMYAYAAAGAVGEYTGADLVRGMKRLVDMESTIQFDIGPDHVPNVLSQLLGNGRIRLNGVGGPPSFDESTGTYQDHGSVWCICESGPSIEFDAMRYDETTQTLVEEPKNPCCPF